MMRSTVISANDPRWMQALSQLMLDTEPVHTGEWQSKDTSASKVHATYEMMDVRLHLAVPPSVDTLQMMTMPNLPWAEDHFLERVSGIPHNPPPSHKDWPWARHNADHQDGSEKFSHTYPERFWPRYTGGRIVPFDPGDPGDLEFRDGKTYRVFKGNRVELNSERWVQQERQGIRFRYGDLNDVVDLLVSRPLTRQAYLPVWFPEDTGAHHGQRVPCTIGYHFMVRDAQLHCWYTIRSCDLVRHLRDDVYLAARLMQWMVQRVNDRWSSEVGDHADNRTLLDTGILYMTISSLHAFVGDEWKLRQIT